MFRLACIVSLVAAQEDETVMLSARNLKLQDELNVDVTDMSEADHQALSAACITAFGESAADACTVCKAQATSSIVAQGHHASLQNGAYLDDMLQCMADQGALPPVLQGMSGKCQAVLGGSEAECLSGAAHCFANHQNDNCNLGNLAACLDDAGFMACAAHKFEYTACHNNVNGVGHCMACLNDCLGDDVPTEDFLGSDGFKACAAACGEPATEAQGDAASLCTQYYPNNMHKCIGCALFSKGDSQCTGHHCLNLPAFVRDQIMCMWNSENEDGCDAVVPAPYRGAEQVCEAAYGHLDDGTSKCLKAGAHCLALHPCSCIDSCSQHNGWFSCFAQEMEFTACNNHPSGVAKCMTCGAQCLIQEQCGSPEDCMADPGFISCHRGCAACATSE